MAWRVRFWLGILTPRVALAATSIMCLKEGWSNAWIGYERELVIHNFMQMRRRT